MDARRDVLRLPSSATLRFALLVVAAIGAATVLGDEVYDVARREQSTAILAHCEAATGGLSSSVPRPGASPDDVREIGERLTAYDRCLAPERLVNLWFASGAVAVLVAVATGLYLLLPRWRIRRRRLEPIDHQDGADVAGHVAQLCHQEGIDRPPVLLWRLGDGSTAGHVFGALRRKYLALPQGLMSLYGRDRPVFDAIVRHELAHLRNRDVDQTYLTVTTWWAFLLVAAAPLAASLARQPLGQQLGVAWRVAALVALVYWLRNGVLRSREYLADLRASGGAEQALHRVLSSLRPLRPWQRLGLHPSPQRRLAILQDPRSLLRFTLGDALAIGLVASLTLANARAYVGLVDPAISQTWPVLVVVATSVGLLVGIEAWRSVAASQERPIRHLVIAGAVLGLGMLLGEVLAFGTALRRQDDFWFTTIGYETAWAIGLIAANAAFVAWAGLVAALWFPVDYASKPGRSLRLGGALLLSGAVYLGGVGWVLSVSGLGTAIRDVTMPHLRAEHADIATQFGVGPFWLWLMVFHPILASFGARWFALPLMFLVWLGPLVGVRLRRAAATSSTEQRWPNLSTAAFGHAAVGGALVGGLVGLGLLALHIGVNLGIPLSERAENARFGAAFFFWFALLLTLGQVAAAVGAALRPGSGRAVLALLAASVAGAVGWASFELLQQIRGCVPLVGVSASPCRLRLAELSSVPSLAPKYLAPGLLLSLLAGAAAAVVGRVRGRPRLRWLRVAGPPVAMVAAVAAALLAMNTAAPITAEPTSPEPTPPPGRYDTLVTPVKDDYFDLIEEYTGLARSEQLLARGIAYCELLDANGGDFDDVDRMVRERREYTVDEEVWIVTAAVGFICTHHLERFLTWLDEIGGG